MEQHLISRFRTAIPVPCWQHFAAVTGFMPIAVASLVPVASAAQELVPNGGFESLVSCPTDAAAIALAAPWISPTNGSTDLFNTCSGSSCPTDFPFVCVPHNWVGHQMPHTGEGYAGFVAYWSGAPQYREYLQVPLTDPLVAGATYTVSFHVSLGDDGSRATSSIGAFFSPAPVGATNEQPLSQYTPQVMASDFITDKEGWTLIAGCFTAAGGERFLTIGNFSTFQNTPLMAVQGGVNDNVYYYVDDVSVVAGSDAQDLWDAPVAICTGDSLMIDLSDLGLPLTWENGSTDPVRTIHGAGTYWVEVQLACGTWSDTLEVMPAFTMAPFLGADTVLCAGDAIVLDATIAGASYTWQDGATTPTYTVTVPGIYWVEVRAACTVGDTIVIGEDDCVPPEITMPNVFTPNGDGGNDIFLPIGHTGIAASTLSIYNRWGQLVFLSSKAGHGWDGTVSGVRCPDGTYFYILDYEDVAGRTGMLTGHLTLLR